MPTGPEHRESPIRKIGHFVHDNLIDKIFPQEDLLADRANVEPIAWTPDVVVDVDRLALMNDPYAQADRVINWPDEPNLGDAS